MPDTSSPQERKGLYRRTSDRQSDAARDEDSIPNYGESPIEHTHISRGLEDVMHKGLNESRDELSSPRMLS